MRLLNSPLCLLVLSLLYFLLPLPPEILLASPVWPLLVLCCFQGRMTESSLLCLAAFAGIALDVIDTVVWGEHMLAMVVAVFVCCRLQRELTRSVWSRQCMVIVSVVWLYAIIIFLCERVLGQRIETEGYWLSLVSSLLVWPWVRVFARGGRLT